MPLEIISCGDFLLIARLVHTQFDELDPMNCSISSRKIEDNIHVPEQKKQKNNVLLYKKTNDRVIFGPAI